jgi:hypothetical protein
MAEYKATLEQWNRLETGSLMQSSLAVYILELRARVQVLEDAAQKHIVKTNSNIVALFSRVESLEAAERESSKVYQINKPLQLTPEQAQQINDLLAPNSKATPNPRQIKSSLVERVQQAINTEYEESLGTGSMEARAAIREVAAWFGDRATPGTPQWIAAAELTDEVDR